MAPTARTTAKKTTPAAKATAPAAKATAPPARKTAANAAPPVKKPAAAAAKAPPARKATPPPAPPNGATPEPPPAPPAAGAADPPPKRASVPFGGRTLTVMEPTIDQLAMFQRMAGRFAATQIDAQETLRVLNVAIDMVTALLPDPAEVQWLESELISGRQTIASCTTLIVDAAKLLREEDPDAAGNRQERRTARRARD